MHKSLLLFLVLSVFGATAYAQQSGNYVQSHLIPDSLFGGNLIFAIDTPSVSYKPYIDKSPAFSNSGTIPIYMYARLAADPAVKMKMVADTGGVVVDTVQLMTGSPVTFNLTFTTTLKPSSSALTLSSSVDVFLLTKFQTFYVPFQTDTLKFTVTFPAFGSSGVAEGSSENPLLVISPNPASGQMILKVSVPNPEPVTIEIYDVLGNKKTVITEGEYVTIVRDFHFDASGLHSGSYIAKLTSGTQVITRNIFIQK